MEPLYFYWNVYLTFPCWFFLAFFFVYFFQNRSKKKLSKKQTCEPVFHLPVTQSKSGMSVSDLVVFLPSCNSTDVCFWLRNIRIRPGPCFLWPWGNPHHCCNQNSKGKNLFRIILLRNIPPKWLFHTFFWSSPLLWPETKKDVWAGLLFIYLFIIQFSWSDKLLKAQG